MALTEQQKNEIKQRLSNIKVDKKVNLDSLINKSREKIMTQQFQETKDVGFFDKIGSSIKDRFGKVKEGFSRSEAGLKGEEGGQTPMESGFQTAGNIAGLGFDILGAGITELGEVLLPEEVERKVFDTVKKIPESKAGQALIGLSEEWDNFSQENPRLSANLESAFNIASLIPVIKAGQQATKTGREFVRGISEATKATTQLGEELLPKISQAGKAGLEKAGITKSAKTLESMIAQKPTKKVIQQAMKDDRLVINKYNILTGKKADEILPSKSVIDSAKTIRKRIPEAIINSADEQKLLSAIQKEVSVMSNKLRPSLKKIELNPVRKNNILNRWYKTKAIQKNAIDFDSTVAKMQTQFEDKLNSVYKTVRDNTTGKFRQKDLNDLWEIRKSYDNSIPESIKNANSLSTGSQQLKKEIWLENRRILNDIMEQETKKLGKSSREVFKEMSSLYEAESGILSQATIAGSEPGLLQPLELIKRYLGLNKLR